MIYHVLFALFAGKAAGFAAHPHDDHDMQTSMPCTPGPPEPLPGTGLQPASDIYQGITVARIKPMMVDRLTKCIYGSYFYEPPDHNPCGPIDPAHAQNFWSFAARSFFSRVRSSDSRSAQTDFQPMASASDGMACGSARWPRRRPGGRGGEARVASATRPLTPALQASRC